MRKKVLIPIIMFLFLNINILSAQQSNTFSISSLKDKEWIITGKGEKNYTTSVVFKQDETVVTFTYENKENPATYKYYLSDVIDTKFQYDKLGSTSGKYIVRKQNDKVIVFEIVKLINDSMSLKNLKNGVTIDYHSKNK